MFQITSQIYAAVIFVGILIGSLLFGILSDRYGRKTALMTAIASVSIVSLIEAYMPTAAGFGFFRFLKGRTALNINLFDKTILEIITYCT